MNFHGVIQEQLLPDRIADHHHQLQKICTLARQDLMVKNEEQSSLVVNGSTPETKCKNSYHCAIKENLLPFLRVSRRVCRNNENLECSAATFSGNNEKGLFDENHKVSVHNKSTSDLSTVESKMGDPNPFEDARDESKLSFQMRNATSRGNASALEMLAHPSKLRPKKRKDLDKKREKKRKMSFDVNSHLQLLKMKWQKVQSPGLKPILSENVKRICQDYPLASVKSLPYEEQAEKFRYLTWNEERADHRYLSLYEDSMKTESHSTVSQFEDQTLSSSSIWKIPQTNFQPQVSATYLTTYGDSRTKDTVPTNYLREE